MSTGFAGVEYIEIITPDGLTYPLTPLMNAGLLGIPSGLGIAPLDWRTQSGPNQDGHTVTSYRYSARMIEIVIHRETCSADGYQKLRQELINILRPNRSNVIGAIQLHTLRFLFDDMSERTIEFYLNQDPLNAPGATSTWRQYTIEGPISIICPDPFFKNPLTVSALFPAIQKDELTFPVAFPIIFNTLGALLTNVAINYAGDVLTYPTIIVNGPVEGFSVFNTTTNEQIIFTRNIAQGETVTINLANQTAFTNTGIDFTSFLDPTSDFGTFHIAPLPEAPEGINNIQVVGDNTLPETLVTISYFDAFQGLYKGVAQ